MQFPFKLSHRLPYTTSWVYDHFDLMHSEDTMYLLQPNLDIYRWCLLVDLYLRTCSVALVMFASRNDFHLPTPQTARDETVPICYHPDCKEMYSDEMLVFRIVLVLRRHLSRAVES